MRGKWHDIFHKADNLSISLWNLKFGLFSLSDPSILYFTIFEAHSYLFAFQLLYLGFLPTCFNQYHMGMHRTIFKKLS